MAGFRARAEMVKGGRVCLSVPLLGLRQCIRSGDCGLADDAGGFDGGSRQTAMAAHWRKRPAVARKASYGGQEGYADGVSA